MDPSASGPSTSPGDTNTINGSPHDVPPPPSPDRQPLAVVAKRRVMKAGAFGSPVRRSPRLSCLPLPSPPIEYQVTQDVDESSDDSINNVALHLSRDETPENDGLPLDEPSSVLANRIMRAHDNPSPPPQDLAHPGIPGKDGQFPLAGVPVPPSPFRRINLLERLNQLSDSSFDSPCGSRTPSLGVRPEMSGSDTIPPCPFVSSESSSPFTASTLVKGIAGDGLVPADTIPSSSTQYTIDNLRSRSSQHLLTISSSPESGILTSPPKHAADSSSNSVVSSTLNEQPRWPSPYSERLQSINKSSAFAPDARTPSLPPSNENDMAPPGTQTTAPGGQDNNEGSLSVGKRIPPSLKWGQESGRTSTGKVDSNLLQRADSPHSAAAFEGLCFVSESTSSVDQTLLPAGSIPMSHQSATPQTPTPFITYPDFSRTSVQRPAICPTPVRANGSRKLSATSKVSSEVDDIYRTPAQRVPIETAFSRETSSLQRTMQLSTDRFRPERSLTIKAPVFTRPALHDPSRSPAKRIPIADLAVSPTRVHEAQTSPTQLGLRARSASVEPRQLGTALARSRSIGPYATTLKPDNHGEIKESIFPVVPTLPRSYTKLPFPLVLGQKLSSDPPPSIPEEHENAEIGKSETKATQGVTASNTISQLRQPTSSSLIPRIGNKPYARPPKTGKAIVSTTANNARAPRAPQFQLARKDSETRNSNAAVSSQLANDQHLGSLKRKRGGDVTAPPNSQPVMIRQVVPGILSEKYAPKPVKAPSQVHVLPESGPPKVPQPLKFRKVIDGMLLTRYAPAKASPPESEPTGSTPLPPSPLSELSSLSDEGSPDEKPRLTAHSPACPKSKTSDTEASVVEPSTQERSLLHQDVDDDKPSGGPRRTSRTRKPAQQQYVLDVFNSNTSTRPPPARRKPQSRTEGDSFMGMSATALRALTTTNTTKNQQTVAVLATEVIRKEGLRPESPTVKARTILQKQRDERDMRRRDRAQRRAQMGDEDSGDRDVEGQYEQEDGGSPNARTDLDENDFAVLQKHHRGPGDEEDYETPERLGRIDPLRFEGMDGMVKPVKQVKWHRGLSTAVYLDEVNPKPKSLPKNVISRSCLAPTSKNLPLDPLGNLVDLDNRLTPELVTEHVIVRRYLYDNDIEPEPIPAKMTRSKSKKSKS